MVTVKFSQTPESKVNNEYFMTLLWYYYGLYFFNYKVCHNKIFFSCVIIVSKCLRSNKCVHQDDSEDEVTTKK